MYDVRITQLGWKLPLEAIGKSLVIRGILDLDWDPKGNVAISEKNRESGIKASRINADIS